MEGYTAQNLVTEAYHLRDFEVSMQALPNHEQVADTYYDIEARTPGDAEPTRDQVREMIKTLLTERFKLAFHNEPKEIPVYALIADQHPKLKASDPSEEHHILMSPSGNGSKYRYSFKASTIEDLILAIGPAVDRPLVDKTGLTGKYDMEFEAVPTYRMPHADDPVIATALREFGLKLVKDKALVSILVVDHVEKPSEN